MVYLARFPEKISSLKVISKSEGVSFDYLEKIISKLEKVGLVKAKKGVQGGYFLAKSPQKIKVGEIVRALEGEISLVKCLRKKYFCPKNRKCLVKSFWKQIQNSLDFAFDSLTLGDLLNKKLNKKTS